MKFPGFRRLQEQDFPRKYNDLIGSLFLLLNAFMESVTQILNKRLNFSDNFEAMDINLEITAPVTGLKVKNTLGGVFNGHEILNISNKTNPSEIIQYKPYVSFTTTNDGQILITNIGGLTAGNKYNIRIIFFR
jgi:HAMP domain-containing protein